MFNIRLEIHQTLCYIHDDQSKNNLERSDGFHQYCNWSYFTEGNKKDGNIQKSLQMQTIVNYDFPEITMTFLKKNRAKYIKDFEGKHTSPGGSFDPMSKG